MVSSEQILLSHNEKWEVNMKNHEEVLRLVQSSLQETDCVISARVYGSWLYNEKTVDMDIAVMAISDLARSAPIITSNYTICGSHCVKKQDRILILYPTQKMNSPTVILHYGTQDITHPWYLDQI